MSAVEGTKRLTTRERIGLMLDDLERLDRDGRLTLKAIEPLHREVARLAQVLRQKDPEWRRRYDRGREAAQALGHLRTNA
jgi:hypothetical protein